MSESYCVVDKQWRSMCHIRLHNAGVGGVNALREFFLARRFFISTGSGSHGQLKCTGPL